MDDLSFTVGPGEGVRGVLTPGAAFPGASVAVLLVWAIAAPLAAVRWFRWEE